MRGILRETWPVTVAVETTVTGVLAAAWALGAPWQDLVACGLLFGVLAPAIGLTACWLAERR